MHHASLALFEAFEKQALVQSSVSARAWAELVSLELERFSSEELHLHLENGLLRRNGRLADLERQVKRRGSFCAENALVFIALLEGRPEEAERIHRLASRARVRSIRRLIDDPSTRARGAMLAWHEARERRDRGSGDPAEMFELAARAQMELARVCSPREAEKLLGDGDDCSTPNGVPGAAYLLSAGQRSRRVLRRPRSTTPAHRSPAR